jgi:hypothetical protein
MLGICGELAIKCRKYLTLTPAVVSLKIQRLGNGYRCLTLM